jgi:hypothetical protein
MPLLDHFHPPLYPYHHWESFHSNWATRLADAIAAVLPPEFQVEEHTHAGTGFEIDVAAFEGPSAPDDEGDAGPALATRVAPVYAPPLPDRIIAAAFPETFEVRVFSMTEGLTLVAVIELLSPGNKDRSAERRAFATKCASYLAQGVSLILIDIVTNRHANLHNEMMNLMAAAPATAFPDEVSLYAVAYRPLRRDQQEEIDLWMRPLALGALLPTLPLRLTGDLVIPVDFEATYQEACRRRRLPA